MNWPTKGLLDHLLRRFAPHAPEPQEPAPTVSIAEGIGGHFVYHLHEDLKSTALCGASVMRTSIPMSAWGVKSHLNERWCDICFQHNNKNKQES